MVDIKLKITSISQGGNQCALMCLTARFQPTYESYNIPFIETSLQKHFTFNLHSNILVIESLLMI